MANLVEMEAFTTVVEQGGITVAARRLGMSKSAVSKHITNLEERLGTRLLSRSTRRVSPTDIGLAYYDRVSRVLNDAGEADAMVTALQDKPSGALRVSVATDFGVTHLTPVIGRFMERYPDLSVCLVLQNRYAELISEGYDLGVRVGDLEDSSLKARKFASAEKRLVASPSYLKRHGKPAAIPDLVDHRLLYRSPRPSGHVWTLQGPGNATHQVRAAGALCINDGQSLLTAAMSGLGIAHLPSYLYGEAVREGTLVDVLPGLVSEPVNLHAVYPNGRFVQPKVRAFVDFLVGEFYDRDPSGW
ncbi:MAG: LysR family transcriptional regulator [Paracoccaceae bacterium]